MACDKTTEFHLPFFIFTVGGFNDTTLLLLTQGQHCVKELTFATREISTLSGKCDESGFVDGEADKARLDNNNDGNKMIL